MPELSGTKMVAAIERSTGQNRTADTVAQRKVDKAAGRFEVAHFSKSGSVRVVDEPAGERDVTAEFFGRNIPQTQGMRVNQCLPLFVQNTGQRNADAQDFFDRAALFFNQPLHDSGKHFRIGVRPLIKTLFALIVEKVTGQIDQNCSDMILGDLQSDRKSGIPHGSKCSRLAPTGRFKGADLLHQSHRHQFFDILQYGRPAVVDFCRKLRLRDSVAGKNAVNRSDAVDFFNITVICAAAGHGLTHLQEQIQHLKEDL